MNPLRLFPAVIVIFLQCFIAPATQAQKQQPIEQNWFAFFQAIDATGYRGMNFRVESVARVEPGADKMAQVRMWARVDLTKGRGFFNNMSDRPVTSNKWTTCVIEGKIDTNAVTLYIGGLCFYTGKFYFDNFRLKIETPDGWQEVVLSNPGFEQKGNDQWNLGILKGKVQYVKGYETSYVKENNRNSVLKITGTNIHAYGEDITKGRYFSTNGVKLYYEVYGKGEPLLLLHGNGQSGKDFYKQIPFFEKEYQVIVPDCRGRGKSTINDDELTYHIQASDMSNLLNHLHIDSANIIGWSDGGIIGLIMAKDYPGKVKRLIASGANVLQDSTAFLPGDIPKFNKIISDTTLPMIVRRRYKLMRDYPSIPVKELSKIQCPVLIVAGDHDEILVGHTVSMFEAIPKGQLFIAPKSSHYLLSQNPKVFNEAALKFLKGE